MSVKQLLRAECFPGILFSCHERNELDQHSYCYFVGSAVLLNDQNIETATALGLIVMFTQFFSAVLPTHYPIGGELGKFAIGLTGAERIQEMFDAEEEIRPQNAPVFNELKEGVEIRNVDFSYLPGNPF